MMRSHPILYLLLSTSLLMGSALQASAQKAERKNIRKGNTVYEKKKYTEAEVAYMKALEANPKSQIATYNLGNALFKQKKAQQALEKYQIAFSREKDPKMKAAITHNAANCYMDLNDYANAVEYYKTSLRLNPSDNETRYNLAVAQAFLKKQQQQQKNNKNKDKDKNKDKNKDKQDQQKQQQQQQDDQQKRQQKKQQQQQKDQQEQVSKEKAQQLLDALKQDEKDTQDKVKKLQQQQSRSKKTEKDW